MCLLDCIRKFLEIPDTLHAMLLPTQLGMLPLPLNQKDLLASPEMRRSASKLWVSGASAPSTLLICRG